MANPKSRIGDADNWRSLSEEAIQNRMTPMDSRCAKALIGRGESATERNREIFAEALIGESENLDGSPRIEGVIYADARIGDADTRRILCEEAIQ